MRALGILLLGLVSTHYAAGEIPASGPCGLLGYTQADVDLMSSAPGVIGNTCASDCLEPCGTDFTCATWTADPTCVMDPVCADMDCSLNGAIQNDDEIVSGTLCTDGICTVEQCCIPACTTYECVCGTLRADADLVGGSDDATCCDFPSCDQHVCAAGSLKSNAASITGCDDFACCNCPEDHHGTGTGCAACAPGTAKAAGDDPSQVTTCDDLTLNGATREQIVAAYAARGFDTCL